MYSILVLFVQEEFSQTEPEGDHHHRPEGAEVTEEYLGYVPMAFCPRIFQLLLICFSMNRPPKIKEHECQAAN